MASKSQPDYSLYYVTGRELTPPGLDFLDGLEQACEGGVTVVQLREKTASTREFLTLAQSAKAITDKYSIPLFINDRLDIALAVGCHLHVGQDDFPARHARQLLGDAVLIGVSVNSAAEMQEVLDEGIADYVGIGPIHATQTKKDHNPVLGSRGCRDILAMLEDSPIKAVAIGGLNEATTPNLLSQSPAYIEKTKIYRYLDGVAVVSAIAASPKPREAAERLRKLLKDRQPTYPQESQAASTSAESMVQAACELLKQLKTTDPLVVQHITNQVVMNDTANLTLALASSPIMSGNPEEVQDIGKIVGCLLLNMGTLNDRQIAGAHGAGRQAKINKKPIILDPVGVGASQYRKETVRDLMNDIHIDIIKGNAGEIGALAGLTEVQSRGVDSAGPGFKDPVRVVRELARREKTVVVMTGKIDYISDGQKVFAIENGHAYQGDITGSGCMATTAIACFATVAGQEGAFQAAVAGILAYNVAAEIAAARPEVNGPNTFRSALIDAAYNLRVDDIQTQARIRLC